MQNITKNVSDFNMTGNRQISIIATDEVKSITLTSHNTKTLSLQQGHSFGIIESDQICFSCRLEEGRYIHDISCRMVSTLGKWDSLFNRMSNKRWLVKVVDNNNITWLSGSLFEPLVFRWEHIGEDKPSGEHSYRLSFGRESTEPLFITDTNQNTHIERDIEVEEDDLPEGG